MKSQIVTNVLLLVIVALLLGLWIQNMQQQKNTPQPVVIYQNGSPVGSGLRATRGNALPVTVL